MDITSLSLYVYVLLHGGFYLHMKDDVNEDDKQMPNRRPPFLISRVPSKCLHWPPSGGPVQQSQPRMLVPIGFCIYSWTAATTLGWQPILQKEAVSVNLLNFVPGCMCCASNTQNEYYKQLCKWDIKHADTLLLAN